MVSALFRLFHIFPTPYYDYYNKFNIDLAVQHPLRMEQKLKPVIQKRRDKSLNIICDKTLLSAAIDGVSKAVTLRSTIPVLEGILLKAEGFQLTLTGYDLERKAAQQHDQPDAFRSDHNPVG